MRKISILLILVITLSKNITSIENNCFIKNYKTGYHLASNKQVANLLYNKLNLKNNNIFSFDAYYFFKNKNQEQIENNFSILSYYKTDNEANATYNVIRKFFDLTKEEIDIQVTRTQSIIYYKERKNKPPIILFASYDLENLGELYESIKNKNKMSIGIYIFNHKADNENYSNFIKKYNKINLLVTQSLHNKFIDILGLEKNEVRDLGSYINFSNSEEYKSIQENFTVFSYVKLSDNDEKLRKIIEYIVVISEKEIRENINRKKSFYYLKKREGNEPLLLLASYNTDNMEKVYNYLKDKDELKEGLNIIEH